MKGVDPVAAIGVSGMADMDKLTSWIAQSRLDPNDPSNADLMYLLRVRLVCAALVLDNRTANERRRYLSNASSHRLYECRAQTVMCVCL